MAELVGVSLAVEEGRAWYIPVAHRSDDASPHLSRDQLLAALRTLLEDPSLALIGQNTKYDIMVLSQYGLWPRNLAGDTMLASYLLNPNKRHNLTDLAWEHLQHRMLTYEAVTDGAKKNFAEVTVAEATRYSGEDAYAKKAWGSSSLKWKCPWCWFWRGWNWPESGWIRTC
jgi:DNA polymerase-1